MITREILETRIQEMTAARIKHQSDVDANTGAIQLCQHLLANLDVVRVQTEAIIKEAEDEGEPRPDLKPNGEAAAP